MNAGTAVYMVELDFPFPEERGGFDAFYDRHVSMLLTVDGFLSAQRFECIHPAPAPLLAVYRLADPDVLSRESYRSKGGPGSVSEDYRPRMMNWRRNLLVGPEVSLEVPREGWLLVVDRDQPSSPPLPATLHVFRPTGLDRSIVERGLAIGQGGCARPPAPQPGWSVRTFRPLQGVRRPD